MSASVEPTLFRLRVAYPKLGRLKYLGHLELIHTVERTVRRASLPYAVTQGFSPHMRIAYTSALPVGTSSICEYYDVFLTELVPTEDALARLRDASPVDMRPLSAGYVELRRPAMTAEITRVSYTVRLVFREGCVPAPDAFAAAIKRLGAQDEIPYTRGKKQKTLAVGRVLEWVAARFAGDGSAVLTLMTRCDNEGSLRPEILIAALDQALRGLVSGVDEEIVSTGTQRLATIASSEVERVCQAIVDDDGNETLPLGHALDVPTDSLHARVSEDALSNL